MGRMLLHANCGSTRRESQRDALIENYRAWAEEHGQDKQIDRVIAALEKTT